MTASGRMSLETLLSARPRCQSVQPREIPDRFRMNRSAEHLPTRRGCDVLVEQRLSDHSVQPREILERFWMNRRAEHRLTRCGCYVLVGQRLSDGLGGWIPGSTVGFQVPRYVACFRLLT